jgi:hypothetical protein
MSGYTLFYAHVTAPTKDTLIGTLTASCDEVLPRHAVKHALSLLRPVAREGGGDAAFVKVNLRPELETMGHQRWGNFKSVLRRIIKRTCDQRIWATLLRCCQWHNLATYESS